MTIEPHESGWRDLADAALGDVEPSELTDRRILKEATRIAAERRAAQARTQARRRWFPAAIAASVALVALGYTLVPGHGPLPGTGAVPGTGGDAASVVPADAGSAAIAPNVPQVDVPLHFIGDDVTLQPIDQDQIAGAVSQIDPCDAAVRLQLQVAAGDALADRRAAAVAAAMTQITGGRCRLHVVPARVGAVVGGADAVLVVARNAAR